MIIVQSRKRFARIHAKICTQIESAILKLQMLRNLSVVGFGFTGNASNRAIVFVPADSF